MARVEAEVRKRAQTEIASVLAKHGKGADWNRVREKFSEVPKTTFYRWVRNIEESGVPAQRALRSARAAVSRRKRRTGEDGIGEDLAGSVVSNLPIIPDERALAGASAAALLQKLLDLMKNAEDLLKHSRTDDGKVRNAKLILQAGEHMRRTAETITKIQTVLWDIQKVERYYQAIFDVLERRDPEVVQLILQDMKNLNNSLS